MSAQQSPNWSTGPYIIQSTLLLVAPALFAASIYMELGRIIMMVKGERFALIRVNWTTKIFVAGDVLSFLMQASGMTPPLHFPKQILILCRRRHHGQRLQRFLWG